MTDLITHIAVGSPDPELKTSPILEESDEDFEVLAQEVEELPSCYFNDAVYADGIYVCSSSRVLLQCEKGLWVRKGGCDPDNP